MLRYGLCDVARIFTTLFGPGPHGVAGGLPSVCNSKSPSMPARFCNCAVSAAKSGSFDMEATTGNSRETGAIGNSCTPRLSNAIPGMVPLSVPCESRATKSIVPFHAFDSGWSPKVTTSPGWPTLPETLPALRSSASCRLCHWFGFKERMVVMRSPARRATVSEERRTSTAGEEFREPSQKR